jgi:hypothetical protein
MKKVFTGWFAAAIALSLSLPVMARIKITTKDAHKAS